MEGKEYLAAIAAFPKTTTVFWQRITAYFPTYKEVWEASVSQLKEAGVPERTLAEFLDFRNRIKPSEELKKLEVLGIRIITITDDEYPISLKEIFNPPFVLFVRGKILPEDNNAIAVVGSRKATDYGKRATSDITSGLSRAGFTIVSGLALGLDAVAHESALKAGGRTIAVLANGLDKIYPVSNYQLGQRIIEQGAIISEYPLGMPCLRQNFPARNRIISGLSKGVLVTEAGEHSGTLHTANFAIEQNRNIYAIPGPIYNTLAHGPNNLLKLGAKAVTCANDILEDFGFTAESKPLVAENEAEELIFKILEHEPKHIDIIAKEAEMSASEISEILSLMEVKGKLRQLGGMIYCLR